MPLTEVPGVPEIRLHLAGRSSGVQRLAEELGEEPRAPYWAYAWGGGVALARHLLDRRGLVAGRRVLDLGTGSGLVAIAAALAGAREVVAVDVDPVALAAAGLNAAANGAAITLELADVASSAVPDVDVVCAGDVFYDPALAKVSLAFLERCRDAGVEVLIGDPWRKDLPGAGLRVLERYEVRDFGDSGRPVRAAVFALAAPGAPAAGRGG